MKNCDQDTNIYQWHILQFKNKLASALWWTNNVIEILILNDFKHSFGNFYCRFMSLTYYTKC